MSAAAPTISADPSTAATATPGGDSPSAPRSASSYRYRYQRVPKADPAALATAARRYRALRLAALTRSPESYSSTLQQEAAFPADHWTERLARGGFETFVCVAFPSGGPTAGAGAPGAPASGAQGVAEDDGEDDGDGDYVAQLTLRGPCEYAPWELPVDSGQPVQRPEEWEREERWQATGLYVHDQHRGRGVAAGICREAMEWVRSGRGREEENEQEEGRRLPPRVRFRTMIAPDNLASVALFRKLGFEDAGLCTMKEGVEANGEVLPEDWAEERAKWCTRGGWVMAKVVER